MIPRKNPLKSLLIGAALALALAVTLVANGPRPALAATPNVAVGAGQVVVLPFHFSGAYSSTATSVAKFSMPFACELLGVGANARAIVGTTNHLDVKLGGTTVLSSPITIAAAGTYYEGTIATSAITDEGTVTVDINIPGTSLTDVTLILTCARK